MHCSLLRSMMARGPMRVSDKQVPQYSMKVLSGTVQYIRYVLRSMRYGTQDAHAHRQRRWGLA